MFRQKKEDIQETNKQLKKEPLGSEEEVWDKKKILFGLFFLCLLAGGLIYLKDTYFPGVHIFSKSLVKGVSTNALPTPAIQFGSTNLQEKMAQIRSQVTHLNVSEVASSSPQVQQVLKEIQGLGNLPKEEAKAICEKICTGL
jgi:hypothetical protein